VLSFPDFSSVMLCALSPRRKHHDNSLLARFYQGLAARSGYVDVRPNLCGRVVETVRLHRGEVIVIPVVGDALDRNHEYLIEGHHNSVQPVYTTTNGSLRTSVSVLLKRVTMLMCTRTFILP